MKIQTTPTRTPSFGMALTIVPKTYVARIAGEDVAEQIVNVTPTLKKLATDKDIFVELYHKYTRIENSEEMIHDMGLEVIVQEDSNTIVEPIRRFMAAHNWIERPEARLRTNVFSKAKNIGEDLVATTQKAKANFIAMV